MKTKLLLLVGLCCTLMGYCQIPTGDLSKEYLFTNGSLLNTASSGTTYDVSIASQYTLATVTDAGNSPNDAIMIDTESFNGNTHPTNQGNYTLSFWLKTSDTQGGQIIEQRIQSPTYAGYLIFLDANGALNFLGRFKYFNAYSNQTSLTTSTSVNDNNWHHIAVTAEVKARSTTSGQTLNKYEYSIYVDGALSAQNETNEIFVGSPVEIFDSGAVLTFNPQNTSGNAAAIYTGDFDNYREYTRVLTTTEIGQLSDEFANTSNIIYVDKDANGSNDGTSWADAYTDFNSAIANLNDNNEIWVAEGVYNPASRSAPFIINNTGIKIYGGFDGTETQLSDRAFGLNTTIFSGDLSNNDGMVRPLTRFVSPPSTKSDNAFSIFLIGNWSNTNPTIFDGVTITHAFLGSAVLLSGSNQSKVPNIEFNNCQFKYNASTEGPSISVRSIGNNSTSEVAKIKINQCVFEKNASFRGAGVFVNTDQNATGNIADQNVEITISNSLFLENATSEDINSSPSLPYEGSAFYLNRTSDKFEFLVKVVNNTFVKNNEQGSFTTSVVSNNTNSNTQVQYGNNIFWDNTANGTTATAYNGFLSTPTIFNCIDPDGFSNMPPPRKSNIITSDPLFRDSSTNNFYLESSSPAVNSGDNSAVIGNVDLRNNQRIINTTIDIGALEFDASLSTRDDLLEGTVSIYPNPTAKMIHVNSKFEIKQMNVYSLLGKKVFSRKNSKSIDISHLQNGLYLLEIVTMDGKKVIKKFLKGRS